MRRPGELLREIRIPLFHPLACLRVDHAASRRE
jgi:hypothetical protein